MKQRFKRTVSWNKYKSDITAQPKSNNLDFIIDAKFRNINRLFVLSLKKDASSSTRNFNSLYYMPLVEIKDSNMLIDKKRFFDQAYEKRIEMSRNDDYTRGNLLDFSYHQKHYKSTGTDLSRQTNTNIPQQINFTEK